MHAGAASRRSTLRLFLGFHRDDRLAQFFCVLFRVGLACVNEEVAGYEHRGGDPRVRSRESAPNPNQHAPAASKKGDRSLFEKKTESRGRV